MQLCLNMAGEAGESLTPEEQAEVGCIEDENGVAIHYTIPFSQEEMAAIKARNVSNTQLQQYFTEFVLQELCNDPEQRLILDFFEIHTRLQADNGPGHPPTLLGTLRFNKPMCEAYVTTAE